MFASLVAEEQTVITQLPIKAIPRRILYSNYLKKLVVATEKRARGLRPYDENYADIPEPHEQDPKDVPHVSVPKSSSSDGLIQISLRIVDPDWRQSGMSASVAVVEDANLRVTALLEWAIEQDGEGKENGLWIVMALEQRGSSEDESTGRVIAINAKNIKKGHSSPHQRVLYRSVRGAIRAICAYGKPALLIAAGNEIILHKLDLTVRKWRTLSKYNLPSPATSISCQGSMVFVATSHHSLIVLVEQNNVLIEHESDSMARNLNSVITFGKDCAMFSAFDSSGTHLMAFSGFSQQSSAPVPMFRAILPLQIDRLQVRKSTGAGEDDRHRFFGSTADGTLYHFQTLAPNEWRLLHFLEGLNHFERDSIKAVPMPKKSVGSNEVVFSFPATKLSDMHVRGDCLRVMIEQGPYNLRHLLRTPEQREKFGNLAEAVIGESHHPVEAVVVWIRRLFRC